MRPILCHLLLFFIFLSCIKEDIPQPSDFALQAGDRLPSFTLSNRNGTVRSTQDLENKMALIIFFTTTCGDCRNAFPDIQSLYDRYKADPSVRLLLIARGQKEEEVSVWFREQNYTMEFYADPEEKVYSLFADNTIPRVFLSNTDQTIILTQTEKVDKDEIIQSIISTFRSNSN